MQFFILSFGPKSFNGWTFAAGKVFYHWWSGIQEVKLLSDTCRTVCFKEMAKDINPCVG